jgi:transposase
MTHIAGHDRSQTLLLPETLDDYVGADNPVRFIDPFVDGLDLVAAGFSGVAAKPTGRPGYAPKDLLKLYIYGYLNRVRSSRRLFCRVGLASKQTIINCHCLEVTSRLESLDQAGL